MKCPSCKSEISRKSTTCEKCGVDIENFKKEQKEKKKQEFKEKVLRVKIKIAIVLFAIMLLSIASIILLNIFAKAFNSEEQYADKTESTSNIIIDEGKEGYQVQNIVLTDKNRERDFDRDYLSNEEEQKLGTDLYSSDTDGDGLSDYEEVNNYKSNPLKYSTADDEISDYVKVQKNMDINKKYDITKTKAQKVEKFYGRVVFVPDDINSEIYGQIEEYETDKNVQSLYSIFNIFNFKGKVQYTTNDENAILLVRTGKKYKEFGNYKNVNGVLVIDITEDDNAKDFVITTRENYNKYLGGEL